MKQQQNSGEWSNWRVWVVWYRKAIQHIFLCHHRHFIRYFIYFARPTLLPSIRFPLCVNSMWCVVVLALHSMELNWNKKTLYSIYRRRTFLFLFPMILIKMFTPSFFSFSRVNIIDSAMICLFNGFELWDSAEWEVWGLAPKRESKFDIKKTCSLNKLQHMWAGSSALCAMDDFVFHLWTLSFIWMYFFTFVVSIRRIPFSNYTSNINKTEKSMMINWPN